MFDKILIANRGEIACRVIQTAAKLGITTVAVYSDADAKARHVALADEAVHIGGSAPRESYLRGDVIIKAATRMGAQAIHPGYGFLSENPGFVEAVEAAGLTFIGPSAKAIRAMGLKDAAKALMEDANVPVVPGYHGKNQDAEFLARQADVIGYPVLIKAVAGGGGKGMRLVEAGAGFATALDSAKGEAITAFGNSDVLIEKYVQKPRHIEVQIFGDGAQAVHLFERDCSLQRRHQKVIEEAPAPGMTDVMRHAMGQAAVRAAEAIGYKGAGTVEFIVDGSDGLRPDRFWFMEMNTRLQVEHPVTEEITGIDLVEWQLRVASGEALPVGQDKIEIKGHAFEARLYAEDVPAGFLPATGQLTHLEFPAGTRADSGVRRGDVISPFYDPMIAKITVHGPSRAAALQKLSDALARTQVAGTVTNLAFLGALTRHKGFSRGEVDTGLIARDLQELVAQPTPSRADFAWAAIVGMGLETPNTEFTGFTLWQPLERSITLQHGDDNPTDILVKSLSPERYTVTLTGATLAVARSGAVWTIDGRRAPPSKCRSGHITLFSEYGKTFRVIDPLERETGAQAAGNVALAPMPGLVKVVDVVPGQAVQEGDRFAVLEAMKMEHSLLAGRAGIVAEVLVIQGDQVEAGAVLIRLEDSV